MTKGLTNELQGWKEIAFELPSLHDVEEIYRKSIQLVKGDPNQYLLSIAMGDPGFRGQRDFEAEGNMYCGFHFFRKEASFFLVFRINPKRSVRLYYMGLAGEPGTEFKTLCSNFVLGFDSRLWQFYSSFKNNLLDEPRIT
jgi:hypothetical protein